ncbi:hypothetical protein WISP_05187 [Willisornis vidua]|uniref:Uncharacterized protein n=1 Tax=Willisornis vidua TaxID=1566151 RepID=A0ABQ9DZ09_9PASS|nr:hypothetical protein WISP_05187 [Willisornis vidua]
MCRAVQADVGQGILESMTASVILTVTTTWSAALTSGKSAQWDSPVKEGALKPFKEEESVTVMPTANDMANAAQTTPNTAKRGIFHMDNSIKNPIDRKNLRFVQKMVTEILESLSSWAVGTKYLESAEETTPEVTEAPTPEPESPTTPKPEDTTPEEATTKAVSPTTPKPEDTAPEEATTKADPTTTPKPEETTPVATDAPTPESESPTTPKPEDTTSEEATSKADSTTTPKPEDTTPEEATTKVDSPTTPKAEETTPEEVTTKADSTISPKPEDTTPEEATTKADSPTNPEAEDADAETTAVSPKADTTVVQTTPPSAVTATAPGSATTADEDTTTPSSPAATTAGKGTPAPGADPMLSDTTTEIEETTTPKKDRTTLLRDIVTATIGRYTATVALGTTSKPGDSSKGMDDIANTSPAAKQPVTAAAESGATTAATAPLPKPTVLTTTTKAESAPKPSEAVTPNEKETAPETEQPGPVAAAENAGATCVVVMTTAGKKEVTTVKEMSPTPENEPEDVTEKAPVTDKGEVTTVAKETTTRDKKDTIEEMYLVSNGTSKPTIHFQEVTEGRDEPHPTDADTLPVKEPEINKPLINIGDLPMLPGETQDGNMQQYVYRQEPAKKCQRRARVTIRYPAFVPRIVIRRRFQRAVRMPTIIRTVRINPYPSGGVLRKEVQMTTYWRGLPKVVHSTLSIPNQNKPDGYDYYAFSYNRYYSLDIGKRIARPVTALTGKTVSKDWYNCPSK